MKSLNKLFVNCFIAIVSFAVSGCATTSSIPSRNTDVEVPQTVTSESISTKSSTMLSSSHAESSTSSDFNESTSSRETSNEVSKLRVDEISSNDSEETSSKTEPSTHVETSEMDNSNYVYDTSLTNDLAETRVNESSKDEEPSKTNNVDNTTKTSSNEEFDEPSDSDTTQNSTVDEDSNDSSTAPAIVRYGICCKTCEIVTDDGEKIELEQGNYVSLISTDDKVVIYWYGSPATVSESTNIIIFDDDYEPNFSVGKWAGTITN